MDSKTIYERDSDQDGLTDAQELALGTNPFSSDSDGDGKTDLEEVQ
ncbi:calcium-binding protein, partial [Streptococcus agalactiae]